MRIADRLAIVTLLLLLLGIPMEAGATNADGDLRLVNAGTTGSVIDLATATAPSGRLEIFDDEDGDGTGTWKGICDNRLEDEDGEEEAKVACRQLGFSGGTPLIELRAPVETEFLLSRLECRGSEDRILGEGKCRHNPRGQAYCSWLDDSFGVTCAAAATNNDAVGELVITGTTQLTQTLTADHSGITDADGKPTDAASYSYQWVSIHTNGYQEDISGATSSTYVLQDSDEEKEVKVRMSFTDDASNDEEVRSWEVGPVYTNKPDGSIRLRTIYFTTWVGGFFPVSTPSDEFTGMVQIYDEPSRKWKGVCDDGPNDVDLGWGTTEAEVACGQLGFDGGEPLTEIGATNVYPPILFLLDEVDCGGTEDRVLDCSHAGRGIHDCISTEYAGVSCDDPDAEDEE